MEMESSKCRRESEDKQMGRKRKKVEWFVFLPDDILLEILKRVPDVIFHYKAKYVCRRWFKIITSRILLDHHSFILTNMRTVTTHLVDIREEEGLQVKEQYIDIPFKGEIMSWCNEFVLISDGSNLYVYNVITKDGSYLPRCKIYCGGHDTSKCAVTLCIDGFKGIYKVIHLIMGPPIQCEILVLRSDNLTRVSSKWKKIQVPYMSEGKYFEGHPVLVEGRYLHLDVRYSNHLISMDLVKEEIFQTKLPGSGYFVKFVYSSFLMGGKLAKIEMVSREKGEIWILKDFQKKKWEKLLHSVDVKKFLEIEGYPGDLYPVCGVKSKGYIILEFRPIQRLFSYDLKEGVVKDLGPNESYDHCMILSSAPSFI